MYLSVVLRRSVVILVMFLLGFRANGLSGSQKQRLSFRWERGAYTLVKRLSLEAKDLNDDNKDNPPQPLQYVLPLLKVVYLERSGWSRDAVISQIREVVRIYRKCSLGFSKIEILLVRAPSYRVDFKRFAEAGEDSLLELRRSIPEGNTIIVYLMGKFLDNNNAPLDTTGLSNARWRQSYEYRPELLNTVFISNLVLTEAYQSERTASPYNIIAHELLHVLTRDGGHYNLPEKNLMNIWRFRSNDILPMHCAQVVESEHVRGNEGPAAAAMVGKTKY